MSNFDDAIQYSRAIHCNNLSNLDKTNINEYLCILKSDWNLRAIHNASSYVCAIPNASEYDIALSGNIDVKNEFFPRVFGKEYYENFKVTPIDTVLEIGCGFGRMTMFIAQYCNKLYAVDISKELLEIAKKRLSDTKYNHVKFIETDGMHLDGVPDNSIDVAFEYIVFQHCPSQEIITSYIKEVSKKLKVGGIFVMHGRDLPCDETGTSIGNTWHGCRCGGDLVRKSIENTNLRIEKEEGIGTERYWATLKKY